MKIELENISIGYFNAGKIVEIQKNVSGTLNSGEFVCLLGPNGAGKTTLLRTLSGLLPALSGEVKLDGQSVSTLSSQELARLISIVLTERPSVTSMTVQQLVGMGRSPYTGFWGRLMDKDHKLIREALKETGTMSLKDRLVHSLSDGECQRVMIARALAQETQAVFLDEPTAFLDFPSKAGMMLLLRRLAHTRNKAVLLSTHDINIAISLADRLWMVDKKLGVMMGTPEELVADGTLQRYFEKEGIVFDNERMEFLVNSALIDNS